MMARQLGRYTIERTIARGGMAEVCLARDNTLHRQVALKLIFPHLFTDPALMERFRREAMTIASLRHRNIIQVYDFDIIDGQPFMVMEYLPGGTLKERLDTLAAQGQVMPIEDVPRLLLPLASAIDYAHAQGAVHRDIKPANILFTAGGEPVITDFGVARILGDDTHRTLSGAIVGSPAYMSPEQAAGQRADARSDLYSLGVILYQLVTGRVPFTADSPTGVMVRHLAEPIPPPRLFNPKVPEEVERVVFRAMAKAPERRFASATEMARALQQALRARSPMTAEELRRILRRSTGEQAEPTAEGTAAPPPRPLSEARGRPATTPPTGPLADAQPGAPAAGAAGSTHPPGSAQEASALAAMRSAPTLRVNIPADLTPLPGPRPPMAAGPAAPRAVPATPPVAPAAAAGPVAQRGAGRGRLPSILLVAALAMVIIGAALYFLLAS